MWLKNNQIRAVKPYLLVVPLSLYLFVIVFGGIGLGLTQSLGYFKAIGMTNISFKYYLHILSSPTFLDNLYFSLYTSIVSSIIAICIGVFISLSILEFNDNGKKIAKKFEIPISIPHIVVVLMVMTMFTKTGFFARLLHYIFPEYEFKIFSNILFNKNGIGIILVYIWKEIPFVALTVHSVLSNLDNSLGLVAKNLGANNRQTIFYVLLPLSLPTIFSAFIIIVSFSFGAYEVPWLIGPTVPKSLPVQAFIEYTNPMFENRPIAMAYNTLIFLISSFMITVFWVAYKIMTRRKVLK